VKKRKEEASRLFRTSPHRERRKPQRRIEWIRSTLLRSRQNKSSASQKEVGNHLHQRPRRKNYPNNVADKMRGRSPPSF